MCHRDLLPYGGLNARVALAHLRGDPRAKPVALTWHVCIGLGALALLGWLLLWMHWSSWYDYGRIAMCASVTAYAIVSARSWQRKLDQGPDSSRSQALVFDPPTATMPARATGSPERAGVSSPGKATRCR
jgi:hypothetical protein